MRFQYLQNIVHHFRIRFNAFYKVLREHKVTKQSVMHVFHKIPG